MLGVLAYLFLPGLHAFHAVSPACDTPSIAPHAHHGHDHAHHHHHAQAHEGSSDAEGPAGPCHDPASCDVCRVYFATTGGTDIPAPIVACLPAAGRRERLEVESQRAVVTEACPARPSRGPPR